jgi:hypothetical protein
MNQVLYYPFGMRFLVLAFLGKVGGQAFSECKFSFTAVTDQQQVFGLSELRFFDKYGDFLDLSGVMSGWSPGESTSNLVRQLWDTDLETGWQDESAPSVTNPISLTISFSSPAEVAAYDFFSSHSSSIGKPTAWNVSCQEEPGESWSHMEGVSHNNSPKPAEGELRPVGCRADWPNIHLKRRESMHPWHHLECRRLRGGGRPAGPRVEWLLPRYGQPSIRVYESSE